MSFLSTLGKILSVAAPIAAIPFTGGASALALGAGAAGAGSKILSGIGAAGNALSNVGAVASKAAAGSAAQENQQGQLALGYGNQALTAANDKSTQDRANAQALFDTSNKTADTNRQNAVRSQVLNNLQDATISGLPSRITVPTISGGARPSVLTTNKDALMAQLAQPAPSYQAPAGYQAPTLPTMPTPGTADKILGGVGLGSSLLGAIGAGLPQQGGSGMETMPTFTPSPTPQAPSVSWLPQSPDLEPQPGQNAFLNPDQLNPNTPAVNPYGRMQF